MSKFTPSKEQKEIFKFILNGEKNAVISAVAGSGKTTTLLEALKLIPEKFGDGGIFEVILYNEIKI